MTKIKTVSHQEKIAGLAKRFYITERVLMEQTLRTYGLGATQWHVLNQLTHHGSMMQRDLMHNLQLEHATLSIVTGTLMRKNLVEQLPDKDDRRIKQLRTTPVGVELWSQLPDLTFIQDVPFKGLDDDELQIAIRVLQSAIDRIENLIKNSQKITS